MQCPACKLSLRSELLHGRAVRRCIVCSGLWLEKSALAEITRQPDLASSPTPGDTTSRDDIHCLQCDRLLVLFNYAHDSGIFIRRCDSCSGVWLEEGQLARIAGYRSGSPAARRLEAALADELRIANRWRLAVPLLRSRLLSGCVAIAYLLMALLGAGSLESAVRLALFLMLPLACIWFPDGMGSLTGVAFGLGRPTITHKTPGDFVALGGWLLLLCPIAVALMVLPGF